MDNFLATLKGSYSLVFLSVLAAYLITFIDSKITGKEIKPNHYAKVGMLVVVISSLIVYIHSLDLKIDEDGSRYVYSAFIRLPIEKINLLKKNGVVKWQLYVYESGYSEDETTEFMAQVNCLSNKN